MNPIILKNGKRLTRPESDAVIKKITLADCHFLGRWQPAEAFHQCDNEKHPSKGFCAGHGICLHNKYFRKESPCTQCRSEGILKEMNWLFKNRRRLKGYRAEWPPKRQRRKASNGKNKV